MRWFGCRLRHHHDYIRARLGDGTVAIKLNLSQKGLLLVGALLATELLFIGTLAYLLHQAEHDIWKEAYAKAVFSKVDEIDSMVSDARGYLTSYADSKSILLGEQIDGIIAQLPEQMRLLQVLCLDSPVGAVSLGEDRKSCDQVTRLLKRFKTYLDGGGQAVFRSEDLSAELYAAAQQLSKELHQATGKMKLFTDQPDSNEAGSRLVLENTLFFGVVLNIVMACGLAIFFARGITGRLSVITDNTHRISQGLALNSRIPGTDEISQLDGTVHEMAGALKEVDQLKREFFAMVTHDLRSPLTAVKAILTLWGRGVFGEQSEDARSSCQLAERSVNRLIRLISDLLDIEKIEAGKWDLVLSPCLVSDLFDRSVETVAVLAQEKSIAIKRQDSPVQIIADENRLIQVLVNLLSNAIKFTPAQASITLGARELPGWIEIRVTDEGRGIARQDLERVFDRFEQSKATDAALKGGTGLGLAVCKAIVAEHKGQIGVESEEGHGACFWFRLPVTG